MSDEIPNRQSIRLPGYDYSQNGYYFITICTHEKQHIFGNIVGAQRAAPESLKKTRAFMQLNEFGKIVQSVWYSLPKHHSVKLDAFQIMPNHIHFILILMNNNNRKNIETGAARCAPTTIGSIVRSFKSESSKQIHQLLNNAKIKIFQRNFYEHIVLSEREFKQIHYYIQSNPQNWETDENNVYA